MRVTIVASMLAFLVAGCGDDTNPAVDGGPDLAVGDSARPQDLTPNTDLPPNLDLKPNPDMAPRFSQVASGTSDFLAAVRGFGTSELYVVGGLQNAQFVTVHGTILHSKDSGAHWTSETVPVTAFLYAVWGPSATDVYAVGEGGTIVHSTGNGTWTKVTSGATVVLDGIWGSGATDLYAVGEAGTILHSVNGTTWAPTTGASGTTEILTSVWGSGPTDVYVVGTKGVILHTANVGVTWDKQTNPTAYDLTSVFGTANNNVFAVGAQGVVLRSTGNGTWTGQTSNVTSFLNGVTTTGQDLWIVGSDGTILESNPSVMGGAFQPVSFSLPATFGNYFTSVWGSSEVNVFIVGANGAILH